VWSAYRQASYGHGELQVFNATHMLWQWHQNPDLEPVVADQLWVVKGQSWEAEHTKVGTTGVPVFRRRAL